MNWISDLAKVYDDNESIAGKAETVSVGKEKTKTVTLVPISHIAVNIPIQINLDKDGGFKGADVIDEKDNQRTIIPATLKSASRSSGSAPMPIDDTLKYIAKDYYPEISNKDKDSHYYSDYINQLKGFVEYVNNKNSSDRVRQQVNAIYTYVSQNDIFADLLFKAHLFGDEIKQVSAIPMKWTGKEEKPAVYKAITGDLDRSFVRFNVRGLGLDRSFEDPDLYEAWGKYYLTTLRNDTGVDYVDCNNDAILTDNHPKGIIPSASNAKLISANDTTNYTFKGRLLNSDEVATIGYLNSQKAHHALRWLIDKQGFSIGGRYYLAWGRKQQNYMIDNQTSPMFKILTSTYNTDQAESYTNERLAKSYYNSLVKGIELNGDNLEDLVYLMQIDTSTPGRADIVSYQALDLYQYIRKLSSWYGKISLFIQNKAGEFVDPPYSLRTIANMIHGSKANDDLKKNTISELISVILGSQIVPRGIIMPLYNKAIRPLSFNPKDPEARFIGWQPIVRLASKLLKTWYENEGIKAMLNDEINDRSYLYGRLLAVADVLEGDALKNKGVDRPTNAQRYMSAFAQRPADTWKTIYMNAQPYFKQSKGNRRGQILIDHIFDKLQINEENINRLNDPLDGKFLIGYSQQKVDWIRKIREYSEKKQKEQEKGDK